MRVGETTTNMPGSFAFEIPEHARPSFYRTPASKSNTTPSRDGTVRKRARYNTAPPFDGPSEDDASYFSNAHLDWSNQASAQSSGFYDATGIESPSSLVYTKYQLRYGPESITSAMALGDDTYGDSTYRQTRYRDGPKLAPSPSITTVPNLQTPDTLAVDGNSRKRGSAEMTASPPSPSWPRTVIGAVGGVAGKVLSFCWSASSGAFRGFYAGGGRSYPMSAPSGPNAELGGLAQDDVFGQDSHLSTQQALPGQFPEDVSTDDLAVQPALNLTAPNALSQDPEWVLIRNSPGSTPSISRAGSPALHTHRKIPRLSSHGHTRKHSSPSKLQSQISHSSVSVAFSPRPMKRITRTSTAGSPSYHKRTSSTVSQTTFLQPVRSPGPSTTAQDHQRSPTSPASVEAKKLAAKMRRREKEEDASLRRLNDQLQAMIREGKEALGTKFEVDDFEDDEDGPDEGIGMDLDEEYHR